jgi:hypothetical protein
MWEDIWGETPISKSERKKDIWLRERNDIREKEMLRMKKASCWKTKNPIKMKREDRNRKNCVSRRSVKKKERN